MIQRDVAGNATDPSQGVVIARLNDAERIPFGPLATYQKLVGDDGGPIYTGVQTCAPGYATPLHRHPYVECLFIIEGRMEAFIGESSEPAVLLPGDLISFPAGVTHLFRNPGPDVLRLLGIHNNPTRIVERVSAP